MVKPSSRPVPRGFLVDPADVAPEIEPSRRACYSALRSAALEGGPNTLAPTPQDADFVLLAVAQGAAGIFRRFRENEAWRWSRPKAFGYSTEDRLLLPELPGLYPSVLPRWVAAGWARGAPYLSDQIHRHGITAGEAALDERDLLFSFVGAGRNHRIRSRLLTLRHPRALLEDADRPGDPRLWWERPGAESALSHFRAILLRSKFVLCPRGVSPASIRLFEAMEAGCVPVILSDRLSLPAGPAWDECALVVAERDWRGVPRALEALESSWPVMSRRVRTEWEAHFSPPKVWSYFCRQIGEIAAGLTPAKRSRIERRVRLGESYLGWHGRGIARRVADRLRLS